MTKNDVENILSLRSSYLKDEIVRREMLAEADTTIVARRKQYEDGLITISELVNSTIAALSDLHHYCATKDNEHRIREICAEMITNFRDGGLK